MLRLWQWALRDEKQAQVRIRDQKKHEYQLDALHELNPVKGQSIELNNNYPEIDPIEIYAWFLGMNINLACSWDVPELLFDLPRGISK